MPRGVAGSFLPAVLVGLFIAVQALTRQLIRLRDESRRESTDVPPANRGERR